MFRRGNIAIAILGGIRVVGQANRDAAELAAIVDSYLSVRPDEKLNAKESSTLKKLKIVLRDAAAEAPKEAADRVVVLRKYDLSVSGIPERARDDELRFYVDHGTITRLPTGGLRIMFHKEGSHKIRCYCIDSQGNCAAWSVKEVVVQAAEESEKQPTKE